MIVRKRAKQEPDLVFVRQIEKRRRFVEQDHRRILGQRTGDHDPLPLTVAEGVDTLVAERFHSHQPQGLFHCRAVGVRQPSDPVGIGRTAQTHDIVNFQVPHAHVVGRYKTDLCGNHSLRKLVHRFLPDQDTAPQRT